MSILTYPDILHEIRDGNIIISPYNVQCLGTNSYDVHLARRLLTYKKKINPRTYAPMPLDCKEDREVQEHLIGPEGFVLDPGKLYLASTVEYTETRGLVPFLEGKSSLGRLGLSIHVTAGKGDVGFCGHWTMEVTVVEPLLVYAGMPVGQLIYHQVSSPTTVSYAEKPSQKYAAEGTYSDDPKPVASRMWRNFPDGRPLSPGK